MSGFRFKIDRRDLAKAVVSQAVDAALLDAGEFLLEQADRTAPLEEGTMIRSGTVTADGHKVAVAYDTPYVRRQHEDTRLRHDGGRRAKWLEHTFREQQNDVGEFIADRVRRVT